MLHSAREGADEVVTGKIFDYMLARRPILVAGPKGMEAAKIIDEHNLGYTIDINDPAIMRSKLEVIHNAWQTDSLISYTVDDISQFSRQIQYQKLLTILE